MAASVTPTAPPDRAVPPPPAARGWRTSTPARYRIGAAVVGAALVAALLAAATAAATLGSRADRVRNRTGPVLVATQQLYSSLAEADAAAAAVQLSGRAEDREQRRFYEQSLERSAQLLERVSSLVGDDATAHAALADIGARLTRYSGLVEQARAENRAGTSTANATLSQALDVMRSAIAADVAALSAATDARFADDAARPTSRLAVTGALVAAALVCLVLLQRFMTLRTRRLVNAPAVAATLLVVGLAAWLFLAEHRQHADVEQARTSSYEAIATSAKVQAAAYRAKAEESLTLLGTSGASFANASADAASLASAPLTATMIDQVRRGGAPAFTGLLAEAVTAADSSRERAAAAEMLTRWQRYRDASDAIRTASGRGDRTAAAALATGEGNRAFNGFNLAVESLLQDDTEQFAATLAASQDRLRLLDTATIVLPLLALALVVWGAQLRLREYR